MKRFAVAVVVALSLSGLTWSTALAAGPRYCGTNCNPPAPINYALWYNVVHHNPPPAGH